MVILKRRQATFACILAAASATTAFSSIASAQQESNGLNIVVTPTRSPQAISQAGSAVSVITADDIAKTSPRSVADVLQKIPGLDVTGMGGIGGAISVRVRGADTRHTLVLIDGVRVNDPAQSDGNFDFSSIVPTDIERIEVLRGPQSALYGSDAIGGVINIITRKGRGPAKATLQAEGGSYGTKSVRGAISGKSGAFSYDLSANGFGTDGFSRYGYRIRRIERTLTAPLEKDGATGFGASARFGIDLSKRTKLEFGGYASGIDSDYDAGWGEFPDTPSRQKTRLINGFARLSDKAFDGKWRNSLLLFGNTTNRTNRDITYFGSIDPMSTDWTKYRFRGERFGLEYQSDLQLGAFGQITVGGKWERERIDNSSTPVLSTWGMMPDSTEAQQDTRSLFAVYQISPMKDLNLSLSGRLDDVEDSDHFATWRATAAYNLTATSTTFRASIGTGAKAPSLYQRFDPIYGTDGLQPEHSFGIDAGADQSLFDGRLIVSATVFANRFKDLLNFSFSPGDCPPANPMGCFLNVNRARTSGLELSADADLMPGRLRAKAAYTFMRSENEITGLRLARRPEHEGRMSLVFTPMERLTIEPSVVLVGERFSSDNERDRLSPYARFDMRVDYALNANLSLYVRGENLTDARYEEVKDYGTPGRSIYGGLRLTW